MPAALKREEVQNRKPLSRERRQGRLFWSQLRDSNPGPVLYESTARFHKRNPNKELIAYLKARTGLRTVTHDKPDARLCNPKAIEAAHLPTDLQQLVTLWPDLPDHVKAGLIAMAKAAVLVPSAQEDEL